jgi:SAM-dependent methyltransferase
VLEIGASNGWRLARIAGLYGSKCAGVDPSPLAIADGKKRFKNISLTRGLASDIPLKKTFDLVIVNFVLHWVSRDVLLRSVAEIDRTVADGGNLIIGDFAPDRPAKVPYHHLPQGSAFTFKQKYDEIFTATQTYQVVSRAVFHHEDHELRTHIESQDRCAVTLLTKSINGFYA